MRTPKNIRFFALIAAFVTTAWVPLFAGDYSGTAAFSFLNIPVGARAVAMGQAFTAVPNDVQGLAYNPSVLATLTASQASFQHLTYVEDISQQSLMYGNAGRRERWSWGLSANYLRVANIPRTVSTLSTAGDGYIENGDFSTYDMALGGTLAVPIGSDISVGSTVKLVRESLADASSTGGAVDFGVMYQSDENRNWNAGAAIQNLGFASKFADQSIQWPWTFRTGLSVQPFSQWVVSTDFVKRRDTKGEFAVGAEVRPRPVFALRVGYRYALQRPDLGGLSDFSAGVGLRHNTMSFDYAFVPLGDLGQTHRVSFNLRFKTRRA